VRPPTPRPLETNRTAPPVWRERSAFPVADALTAEPATVRVLVVAAYPAVRAGLAALLAQQPGISPIDGNLASAEATAAPDIIVADAGSAGEEMLDELADAFPRAAFVLVGGDPAVDGPGLESGAVGYLAPDADATALGMAVRGVAQGLTVIDPALIVASGVHIQSRAQPSPAVSHGEALTAREREVLALVANGLPNKAIARELGISEHTAKFHVGSLLAKLGAASRTEAVTIATRRGILAV
jgi:two-component system nitrate/nitrite response regulator NarL